LSRAFCCSSETFEAARRNINEMGTGHQWKRTNQLSERRCSVSSELTRQDHHLSVSGPVL